MNMGMHLGPAYTEGMAAFAANLSDKENPYHCGTPEHSQWETGWVTAKISGGSIPVMHDVTYPENSSKILDWEQLAQEIVNDVEASLNPAYMKWFASLDPRAQEIVLALDTPIPSGDLSARARFEGEFEALLILKSRDGEDFVQMYAQVLNKDPTDPRFRCTAASLWNIAASVSKHIVTDYENQLRKRLEGN